MVIFLVVSGHAASLGLIWSGLVIEKDISVSFHKQCLIINISMLYLLKLPINISISCLQ